MAKTKSYQLDLKVITRVRHTFHIEIDGKVLRYGADYEDKAEAIKAGKRILEATKASFRRDGHSLKEDK